MYCVLIIYLLVLILVVVHALQDEWSLRSAGYGIILGCFFGMLPAILAGALVSGIIFGTAPLECKYHQELEVMSNSLYLTTDYIDSELRYIYITEDNNIQTIGQDKQVYIRYTNEQPHVEYWDKVYDPWRVMSKERPHYIFYIPEDNIIAVAGNKINIKP